MILVDTGPLVGLFNRRDSNYALCISTLRTIHEPLFTTVPALTEAFYLLGPGSPDSDSLRQFIVNGDLAVWHLDTPSLLRTFELMELYADHPMDLADASIVTAAESLDTREVFTLDLGDFETYRVRRGHRYYPFEILPRRRR